jgi:hypothetical protein
MIPAATFIDHAACAGVDDPDIFFPEKGRTASREAIALCATCPVRTECGEYATEHDLKGIWGGLSENRRRGRSSHDQAYCRNNHLKSEHMRVQPSGRERCGACITAASRRAYAVRKQRSNGA